MLWVWVFDLPESGQLQTSCLSENLANLELLLLYLKWRMQLKGLVAIWLQRRMVLAFLNLATIPEKSNAFFSNLFMHFDASINIINFYEFEDKNIKLF